MEDKNEIPQIKDISTWGDHKDSYLALLFKDKDEAKVFYDLIKYERLKLHIEEDSDNTIFLVFRFLDNREETHIYNTNRTTTAYSSLWKELHKISYITTGVYEGDKIEYNHEFLPSPSLET